MKDNLKYAFKQGLTSGIATIVLCFAIFIFMTKNDANLALMASDAPVSVFCTALICLIIQALTAKGNVQKGKAPEMPSLEDQASYILIPKNAAMFVLLYTVFAFLCFGCAPIGLLFIFAPDCVLSPVVYAVTKAVLAGFAAMYVTFHSNVFLNGMHQKKA